MVFLPQAFSRAWHRLHVFASNCEWLVVSFISVAIGQSNYFGVGFTTVNWKPLYYTDFLNTLAKKDKKDNTDINSNFNTAPSDSRAQAKAAV